MELNDLEEMQKPLLNNETSTSSNILSEQLKEGLIRPDDPFHEDDADYILVMHNPFNVHSDEAPVGQSAKSYSHKKVEETFLAIFRTGTFVDKEKDDEYMKELRRRIDEFIAGYVAN